MFAAPLSVSFYDIEHAAERLKGFAYKTPLLQSSYLNECVNAKVFLKAENTQRLGSFKFRGAFNALALLKEQDYQGDVVAVSSGNHAQGLAEAARILSFTAHIVMPHDAPSLKVERVKRCGGHVVFYDREREDRQKVGLALAQKLDAPFIPPFDDARIIAGQGTAGLELCQEMQHLGFTPDHVLVCCSGGGLSAGVGLAVQHFFPDAQLYTVEPHGFDDMKRSLISGHREKNISSSGSLCDALMVEQPGVLPFDLLKSFNTIGLSVSDESVCHAMRFAFDELKQVLEPSGAIALAALLDATLRKTYSFEGKNIVVFLSGGNIEHTRFSSYLSKK